MKRLFGIVACVFALCTGFSGAAYSATENVITVTTSADLDQYRNAQGIAPVLFFVSGNVTSGRLQSQFEAVAADYPDVAFVEVDTLSIAAQETGVSSYAPTLIFYHNGQRVETITSMYQMTESSIRPKMQDYYASYYGDSGGDSSGSVIPTSKKYVDDELAKKQPKFSGLGNNKLMLYSNATNGTTLSRDIVRELGDSTSATTVPTRGAILTGMNTKQNTLNGTAGWVVENTGTAGILIERPVYSTTDNYKTALVEADDLNQMIIDAVNSELTQVADGWQINDSVTLPTLRLYLDANIDAPSYYDKCTRSLVGSDNDYDGNCSATVLAVLGATNSKSGKWAALFPYGDIVGKSVCSVTAGDEYGTATEAQESTLNADFNAQSGVGESALNSNQKNYCWCNIESVMGQSVVSGWAMPYDGAHLTSALNCARSCAGFCSGIIKDGNFRSLMFSTIQ